MIAKFKHRLLGTSILVLAGIIFLPDLLDGEKQVVKDDFKVIPDRPEFVGVQQVQPFPDDEFAAKQQAVNSQLIDDVDVLDDADNSSDSANLPSQQYAQVTAGTTEAEKVATPTKVVEATPSTTPTKTAVALNQAAWVVRVGSFSNPQNASALEAKLRQAGFATFTRSITNSNGQPLTSVFVGPEVRRERLEQGLGKLQQLTGIAKLTISNYQPTEIN
ncbi:SPOR domain-containing protein [Alishewanella sp. 16-MA]|uniref:SPOR domain-containing protein n=1 Tax=Alishewanella maricola TaxID=2795740 RepID=A0ABS8C046_9ALTE|nr:MULTISPECIES: SPOR domain-containing protein [Alishewanella]MCB5225693.1 SPOR domain-containing protein [Alishewanella maricola]MDP5036123.1 SPOR domain-containing protein [Alishewanella sp.]MDP5186606.1 SPOR domain-containing protein [Alishewanella sp.]MDP5458383.1 SPOR domain-containing protein [Alishewanella sp. SMS8]